MMSTVTRSPVRAGTSFRLIVSGVVAAVAALVMLSAVSPEASARTTEGAWEGYGEYGYNIIAPKKKQRAAHRARKSQKHAVRIKKSKKKYAALSSTLNDAAPPATSAVGGGVRWAASASCANGSLVAIVQGVASSYGPVTVSSTCRGRKHNASVGGARQSHHLSGNAIDFRVHGNWRGVMAYLRSTSAGGIKHYGGGLFHIDTGARRSW